jgi:hypothetical protein
VPTGDLLVAGIVLTSIALLLLEPPTSYLLAATGSVLAVVGAVIAIRKRSRP